jgi:putative hydrolase of the HAD superfamily
MNTAHIKAILFDSGDTLNHPKSGHWFIPPTFTIFFEHDLGGMDSEAMRAAFT